MNSKTRKLIAAFAVAVLTSIASVASENGLLPSGLSIGFVNAAVSTVASIFVGQSEADKAAERDAATNAH